jgi:hypothetical protein
LFSDIFLGPSSATIFVLPSGSPRYNSAGALAGDENSARSLSADTGVPSVVRALASVREKMLA